MIENKEFQSILKKYSDDLPVAIAITHNDVTSLFYNLEVEGITFEGNKAVIIFNRDINEEYEILYDGGEIDEEIYRE
ncbi:MAG: hypothetical protein IJP99_08500 [Methanobrevibacter sp.]|nr:hypothetical protein [Methanobrevibacter sp.]